MAICRGCGAEALRTSATYRNGELVSEVCSSCRPDRFGEPVTDPSDKRIYVGWEAMPQHYRLTDNPDGGKIAHASDSIIADTVELMNQTDEHIAIEEKRRTRRTEPLTPDEIKAAEHWGREVLRPKLERERLNRQYGHV